MTGKTDVKFIRPPNLLRDRVRQNEGQEVDFSAAEAALEKLAPAFVAGLPKALSDIEKAYSALKSDPGDAKLRTELFRLVHDLKGQAGTFNYMLITVIGNDLCRFIERDIVLTPPCIKVIGFHIEAMKRVTKDKITGDGDGLGMQMVNLLQQKTHDVLQDASPQTTLD